MSKETKKAAWDINEKVGRKFLQSLHSDPIEAEERFARIRRKLIVYISRKLGSIKRGNPEDLADETIRRAARKIGEEDVELSTTIEQYCLGIAFHVLQEYWGMATALRDKEEQLDVATHITVEDDDEPPTVKRYLEEKNLACLRQCLEKNFSKLDTAAILEYYDLQVEPGQTKQKRKTLARRLKTSPKNLSNRMNRYREKLLDCIERCVEEAPEEKGDFCH